MKIFRTILFVAAIVLVCANPDCQLLNTGGCKYSEKHACKADRNCDWSHHNYCYHKCQPLKCGDELEKLKPVLYFKFDDSFADCSENNFIITHNGDVQFAPGHRGKAAVFNTGEVIITQAGIIGTPTKLRVKKEMTFAMWLYGEVNPASRGFAGCWCSGGGYQLYDRSYGFLMYILNPYYQHPWTLFPVGNGWWHLTVQVTTQATTYFVNGVQARAFEINLNSDIQYSDNPQCPWKIGRTSGGGWGEWFYGAIDDFMFFDRALTQGEINTIVQLQSQGKAFEPVSLAEQPMRKVNAQAGDNLDSTVPGAQPDAEQPMRKVNAQAGDNLDSTVPGAQPEAQPLQGE